MTYQHYLLPQGKCKRAMWCVAYPCRNGQALQYLQRYGSMAANGLVRKNGLERRPSKQPAKKKPRKR